MRALATGAWLCLVYGLMVSAQPPSSSPSEGPTYTLEQVLEHASEDAREIEVIRAEIKAGEQEIRFYRAEAYPTLSVSNSAGYAWISFEGIAGVGQLSGGSSGGSFRKARASSQAPETDTSIFDPLSERVDGPTLNWSVSLDQPLITFGRVRGALRLAGMQEDVLEYRRRLQLDQFYQSVIELFGEAYRQQRMVGIAQREAETASRLLEFTRVERAIGAASEIDSLRTQARMAEATADLVEARGDLAVAQRRLSSEAELPQDTGYHLVLDTAYCTTVHTGDTVDPTRGTEYMLTKLETRMRKTQVLLQRAEFFPEIYARGSISNSLFIVRDGGQSSVVLGDQSAGDIVDPSFFDYTVGAQLLWTAFDGARGAARYRQVKAEARRARLELQQLEERVAVSIRSERDRLQALVQSLEAARLQEEAAEKTYERTVQDYLRGFTDLLDVLEAEQAWEEAQLRIAELEIDCLLAQTRLKLLQGVAVYKYGARE